METKQNLRENASVKIFALGKNNQSLPAAATVDRYIKSSAAVVENLTKF